MNEQVLAWTRSHEPPSRSSFDISANNDKHETVRCDMDLPALNDGIALFRSGMEGIRTALGLWRDIKSDVPEAGRADLERALEHSEQQLRIAEAQIAKGLGYPLCHCEFPPTPMLTVGWINARGKEVPAGPVHRCPKCQITNNSGWAWTSTEVFRKAAEGPKT